MKNPILGNHSTNIVYGLANNKTEINKIVSLQKKLYGRFQLC